MVEPPIVIVQPADQTTTCFSWARTHFATDPQPRAPSAGRDCCPCNRRASQAARHGIAPPLPPGACFASWRANARTHLPRPTACRQVGATSRPCSASRPSPHGANRRISTPHGPNEYPPQIRCRRHGNVPSIVQTLPQTVVIQMGIDVLALVFSSISSYSPGFTSNKGTHMQSRIRAITSL